MRWLWVCVMSMCVWNIHTFLMGWLDRCLKWILDEFVGSFFCDVSLEDYKSISEQTNFESAINTILSSWIHLFETKSIVWKWMYRHLCEQEGNAAHLRNLNIRIFIRKISKLIIHLLKVTGTIWLITNFVTIHTIKGY